MLTLSYLVALVGAFVIMLNNFTTIKKSDKTMESPLKETKIKPNKKETNPLYLKSQLKFIQRELQNGSFVITDGLDSSSNKYKLIRTNTTIRLLSYSRFYDLSIINGDIVTYFIIDKTTLNVKFIGSNDKNIPSVKPGIKTNQSPYMIECTEDIRSLFHFCKEGKMSLTTPDKPFCEETNHEDNSFQTSSIVIDLDNKIDNTFHSISSHDKLDKITFLQVDKFYQLKNRLVEEYLKLNAEQKNKKEKELVETLHLVSIKFEEILDGLHEENLKIFDKANRLVKKYDFY